jgi:predicted metal-binding protein
MLLTVDRSNSMVTNDVPGTNGDSRWTVARRVLKSLTQQYQGGIRFGLALWPGNQKQCEAATTRPTATASTRGWR